MDADDDLVLPPLPKLHACLRCHRCRLHHAKGLCAACYAALRQFQLCIDGATLVLPRRGLPSDAAVRHYATTARRALLDDVLAHPRKYLDTIPPTI